MSEQPSDSLYFVRTDSMERVPRQLFEDTIDKWMASEVIERIYQFDNLWQQDPSTFIFTMETENGDVCGVLWLVMAPLFNALNGLYVSVLPEYRDRSIIARVTELMELVAWENNLTMLLGASDQDLTHWAKFGWNKSDTYMIYKEL